MFPYASSASASGAAVALAPGAPECDYFRQTPTLVYDQQHGQYSYGYGVPNTSPPGVDQKIPLAGLNPYLQFTSPGGYKLLQYVTDACQVGGQAVYGAVAATKFTQVFWVQNLYNSTVLQPSDFDPKAGAVYGQLQQLCALTMTLSPPIYTDSDYERGWNPLDLPSTAPSSFRAENDGEPVALSCKLPPSAPLIPEYTMPVCPCYVNDLELDYQARKFGWGYATAHLPSGPSPINPISMWYANTEINATNAVTKEEVCNNARSQFAFAQGNQGAWAVPGKVDPDAGDVAAYTYWVEQCVGFSVTNNICVQEVIVEGGDFVNNASVQISQTCNQAPVNPPGPSDVGWKTLRWVVIGAVVVVAMAVVLGVVFGLRGRKRAAATAAAAARPAVTRQQVLAALRS
jgi:hypothetical protein